MLAVILVSDLRKNLLIFRVPSVPPDHVVTLLEGLTTLCHYCFSECPACPLTIW